MQTELSANRPLTSQRLASTGFSVRLFLGAAMVFAADRTSGDMQLMFLAATILSFGFDTRNLMSLRNFFLGYACALFAVGPALLDRAEFRYGTEFTMWATAFLVGYTTLNTRRPRKRIESREMSDEKSVDWLLYFPIGAHLTFLGFQILRVGASTLYSGVTLTQQIADYAQGSGGLIVMIPIALKAFSVGAAAAYTQASLRSGRRLRYRPLLVLLVILPSLTLQRSAAILGAVLLASVFALERRLGNSASSRPSAVRRFPRPLYVLVVVLLTGGIALQIGVLRETRLRARYGGSAEGVVATQFRQEFSPLILYKDARRDVATDGPLGGRTMFVPLVTQFVPRAIWPSKPPNTSEYLMAKFHPGEFAAGYSMAPSIFGDAFLNFGTFGTAVLLATLGAFAALCDRAYIRRQLNMVPLFLVVYGSAYSVLRDNLSTGLGLGIMSYLSFALLRQCKS